MAGANSTGGSDLTVYGIQSGVDLASLLGPLLSSVIGLLGSLLGINGLIGGNAGGPVSKSLVAVLNGIANIGGASGSVTIGPDIMTIE